MSINPWIGWKAIVAHPDSPAGGSGPGRSRDARPFGRNLTIPTAGPLGHFPDVAGKWWDDAVELWNKAESISRDLARVDWLGNLDTRGLEGDWPALYLVWFFETSPASLGEWSVEGGEPLVIITSEGYVHDLKRKRNYRETLDRFRREHPDISRLRVGDRTTNAFTFTGAGSASGDYNALEWFMGSYTTRVTVLSINPATHSANVSVEVSNTSRWESGTRMPRSFQNLGLPPYFIADAPRTALGPGGTFRQRFVWQDTIQY